MRRPRLFGTMLWVGLCAVLLSGLAGCGGLSAQVLETGTPVGTETAAGSPAGTGTDATGAIVGETVTQEPGQGAGTPSGGTAQGGTSQPGGGQGGGVVATVNVVEKNFDITLDKNVAPPGQIQFNLTNQGPSEHEFVIFKTDLAPNNLPTQGGQVNENASGLTKIAEQQQYPAGETRTLTVNLQPGNYVLICNLPGHYQQGMHVGFTVTEGAGATLTAEAASGQAGGGAQAQASPAASGTPAGGTPTGGTPMAATKVSVIEENYAILMSTCLIPAGEIEFDLRNMGITEHEFVIFRTDLAPNSLPVQNATVNENAPGLQKIAEQDAFPPGETRTLTANLQQGNYVAICNLEGHYQQGMYFGFTVVEVFPGGALGQATPGTTSSPAGATAESQVTPGGTPTGGQASPTPGAADGAAGGQTATTPATMTATATAAGTPTPGGQATTTSTAQTTVQVTEQDFSITLDRNSAPAGPIQFNLTNQGPSEHEFVIFKTDLAPNNLPTQGGQVNENASGLTKIAEQQQYPAGETRTLTVNLQPGNYVLICNLPGHYQQGMHVGFTVTGS